MSAQEQNKIFHPSGLNRIVLATNVAETSLTVPGIKYVIDPGTARISRYSYRTKVQRLPIEPISQASANQRKGRCGRVSEGICIRLYSEEDFNSRPEFTDPEILRTNLASVILQMTALGLDDIEAFPFVDAPDKRHIQDGIKLLEELGAFEMVRTKEGEKRQLTAAGRQLSQLPVDPRLAKMLLTAVSQGALHEVMIIIAALSIQDPRERPQEKQQASDEKHRRFADKKSDFLAFLNLWRYLQEQQKELSKNQFRRQCQKDFLNYLRIREWQDIYHQIRLTVREMGLPINSEKAEYQQIHTALLSGLLSHIGLKEAEKQQYLGARNAHFAIFPNSVLFKKQPKWVMAAELVETSKLWGRMVAEIEPEWIEPLAEHLIKKSYSEPRWSKSRGAVIADEKVTLYGVPIVAARPVNYGAIDPTVSREIFIQSALVEGDWNTKHKFFKENQFLIGLSIDGTKQLHDMYRHDKNGNPTFDRIKSAADLMDQYGVDYNILTVVTQNTAYHATEIYNYYKRQGWKYQQYIACLDPLGEIRGKSSFALKPEQYGRFLVELFNLWYEDWKNGEHPYIRQFENYIGILLGYQPESCEQRGICGIQNVVEADGSVYPCDFYMLDEYRLGNFNSDRLVEIDEKRKSIAFVEQSQKSAKDCIECKFHTLCRGGCRRNREFDVAKGEYANYYCESYRFFFEQCLEKMIHIVETIKR